MTNNIGFTGCNRWVSQTFQWTIVFNTIGDNIYDNNFAMFEWMIWRNQKVRGSNVSRLKRKFFFQKKIYFKNKNDQKSRRRERWTIVLYLKRIHLRTFLARVEITYTTTILQRLIGWLFERRKLHAWIGKISSGIDPRAKFLWNVNRIIYSFDYSEGKFKISIFDFSIFEYPTIQWVYK